MESLSHAATIRDLLGGGDPHVAYTRLTHEILDSDLDLSIKAAAASLGFSSDGDTHLKRLDEFGAEVGLEQRQVRRYSDRGIKALARLIATNWPTETVPQLTVIARHDGQRWELHLTTRRLLAVEMRPLRIEVLVGQNRDEPDLDWQTIDQNPWQHAHTTQPLIIANTEQETSVVIVWRGELWPKHNIAWRGASPLAESESLGNKLMLRLRAVEAAS